MCPTEIYTDIVIFVGAGRRGRRPLQGKLKIDVQRDKNHITHFTAGGRGDPSPTVLIASRETTSSLLLITLPKAGDPSPTVRMINIIQKC